MSHAAGRRADDPSGAVGSTGTLVYSGTVLDGLTGTPIPEATIIGQDRHVTTDSAGRFVIRDAVAGEVSAMKRGYFQPEEVGGCCSSRDVSNVEHPAELHFVLMPKAEVAGRVALPSGAPVAGMQVTLLHQEVSEDGMLVWKIAGHVETPADGSYRMTELMPGAYQVRTEDLVTDGRGCPVARFNRCRRAAIW